jgi:hypothetical protein
MGEVKDMLLKAYLKKGKKSAAPKAKAATVTAKPPAPIPVERPRTLGNITTAMMAQRIYNPSMPPAPKSPSKAMQDQGTAPALGMEGPWGKPEPK